MLQIRGRGFPASQRHPGRKGFRSRVELRPFGRDPHVLLRHICSSASSHQHSMWNTEVSESNRYLLHALYTYLCVYACILGRGENAGDGFSTTDLVGNLRCVGKTTAANLTPWNLMENSIHKSI